MEGWRRERGGDERRGWRDGGGREEGAERGVKEGKGEDRRGQRVGEGCEGGREEGRRGGDGGMEGAWRRERGGDGGMGGMEEGVGDGRGRGRRRVYVCVWSCENKKWGVRAEQLGEAALIRPLILRLPNSVVK